MTERSQRFRARRARLNERQSANIHTSIEQPELVSTLLSQEVNRSLIASVAIDPPTFNQSVTNEDVHRCLSEIDKQFTRHKYDLLFEGVEDVLVDQLLKLFGLSRSKVMDADRDFEFHRKDYLSGFGTTRKSVLETYKNEGGGFRDAYTGKPIDDPDVDHIVSLKKSHKMGGFMLDKKEKSALGNDQNNLAPTHASINRHKSSRDLREVEGLDKRRTNAAYARADKSIQRHIPQGTELARRAATDGVKTGVGQGIQKAFALFFSELLSAIFSEVKDIFYNGWKGREFDIGWFQMLVKRLERIGSRVLNQWKGLATAFSEGALAGFVSATLTALSNMFIRTGKNVVRILREGFLSLAKAIRVLLFPPEGVSLRAAAHEASKVLTTGLVVTGGILAGESIAGTLGNMAFSGVLGSVVGSLISGLGSLLVVFLLDKLDLFGVAFEERHAFVMGTLDGRISATERQLDELANELGLKSSE